MSGRVIEALQNLEEAKVRQRAAQSGNRNSDIDEQIRLKELELQTKLAELDKIKKSAQSKKF